MDICMDWKPVLLTRHFPQIDLKTQDNSNQNLSKSICRNEQTDSKMYMEVQKTKNSQKQSWKKENEVGGLVSPDFFKPFLQQKMRERREKRKKEREKYKGGAYRLKETSMCINQRQYTNLFWFLISNFWKQL